MLNWKTFIRKFLRFDIRPYSAFKFGGRNRRPKAENFRFRPKISASGIPGKMVAATSAMVGRICPLGWDRVKVSENLVATAVAQVAPVVTSLIVIGGL
jgi:hypothetical protein